MGLVGLGSSPWHEHITASLWDRDKPHLSKTDTALFFPVSGCSQVVTQTYSSIALCGTLPSSDLGNPILLLPGLCLCCLWCFAGGSALLQPLPGARGELRALRADRGPRVWPSLRHSSWIPPGAAKFLGFSGSG